MTKSKLIFAAAFSLGLTGGASISPVLASGGDGGSSRGAAVDFFGYFLAGGNPFAAVMQMDQDERDERRRRAQSENLAQMNERHRQQLAQMKAQQAANTIQSVEVTQEAVTDYVEQVASGKTQNDAYNQTIRALSFYNLK
ncbi:MAG: hypothetical protein AAF530_14985 [Pseudomonadota bacterium]